MEEQENQAEEVKTDVVAEATVPENVVEEPMPKKKNILPVIIIIIVLLLVVGIVTFVAIVVIENNESNRRDDRDTLIKKPVIYIYPEKEEDVTITLSDPSKLTVSYPKYNDSWKLHANTDGTLTDKNGKKYYALYWEGKSENTGIKEDGFVVSGNETAEFLEEKLSTLGLNYKERNEFVMYWLPKLESNSYNYIRFKTKEEINDYMKLDIEPQPDTLIRVVMEYKPLDKRINIKEQELTRVERKGYTVVEWGGSELQ